MKNILLEMWKDICKVIRITVVFIVTFAPFYYLTSFIPPPSGAPIRIHEHIALSLTLYALTAVVFFNWYQSIKMRIAAREHKLRELLRRKDQ
jgi:hypothetical protein